MATKFQCCICTRKDNGKEAKIYCVECENYYCLGCIGMHRKLPSLRGHKFLDRCLVHTAELVDIWCQKHNEIACATCVELKHSACGNLQCVSEEADKLYEKSAAGSIKRQLTTTIAAMKDIKKAKVYSIDGMKNSKKSTIDSMKTHREDMESEKDNAAQYDNISQRLKDDIKEAEVHIDELKKSFKELKNAGGNKVQEFLCVKAAEKNIVKANEWIKHLEQPLDMKTTSLPDSETTSCPQQQRQNFGKFSQLNPSVTSQKELAVKLANDKITCSIYGSCFTEDGFLLLTDYSNKKLKRVNLSTCSIEDHLILKDMPFAVCLMGKDEAAVTICNIQSIQFVSLEKKMTATKQLKLNHNCWGLAYSDSRLFTSDCGKNLYIYDLNGTMLRKITTDDSGNPIFNVNRHLSLGSNGDKLYVIDQANGLITLDMQGNYESTFSDPDLLFPHGVCTDGRGNIFVCGWGESNIVHINERTQLKIGVLDKVTNSISTSFNSQQNKLVVTLQNSNAVKIYELEY